MLIGTPKKKPNLQTVRHIKRAMVEALQLPDGAMITITQLACMEEDCAPIETSIGLLRSGEPQLQHKVHKAIEELELSDLLAVCSTWGFSVDISKLEKFFISTNM